MSSITGRYTSSPETVMEMDLAKLRGINTDSDFERILNDIIETQLTNDFWTIRLPQDLANTSSTSPTLYAYYASLYIHDAYGLFSKLKIKDLLQEGIRAKKSAVERHHLFPKAWLINNGFPDQRDTNQIANYALVEWSDNIYISDSHPAEYLPLHNLRFTSDEIEQMYFWHALPENWEKMNYTDFLRSRRDLIAKVIEKAFSKLSY